MNTWAEAMKAIGALEDRVSELEHVVAFGQRKDSDSLTHDGRIVVSANVYERLVEVEMAAIHAVENLACDLDKRKQDCEICLLREALKR